MLVSLTVGKVDAGVAVLLTEDKRLIEFPSILLPADIHSGSIVDINVSRNQHAELITEQRFSALQSDILESFGTRSPSTPVLRCRNATQTSVVLEWDPIDLATAELRSLSLYRNGTKAGVIPRDKSSTKISGLALDTAYTFQLVLRTSAGQYSSEKITVKTHKMTDLTGITITPGLMPSQLRESLASTVHRIGAKVIDSVRIDTTHFVCTEPRGQAWEKAVEMNVPVVVPDWVMGCEREGRIVGVRGYYLDADPKLRQMGPSTQQQQQQQQPRQHRPSVSTAASRDSPRIEHTPPTPVDASRDDERRATAGAGRGGAPPPVNLPSRNVGGQSAGAENGANGASDKDNESDDSDGTEKAEESESIEQQTTISNGQTHRADNPASAPEDDTQFDEVTL